MGSTGTGNFSDYPQSKPSGSNNNNGGTSGEDNCKKAFTTTLEEVENSKYFEDNNDVPPQNTEIFIDFEKRMVAKTTDTKLIIGILPTKFNYLKYCIDDGVKYVGIVSSSSLLPIPNIHIDIIPE